MLQRCCKLSSRSVYRGFSASSRGQAATPRNPLHSLRFLPSSRETATQAQTGDAYVTSEVLYQLSYVGVCRDFVRPVRWDRGFLLRGSCRVALIAMQKRAYRRCAVWCPNTRQSVPPTLTAADRWPLDGEAGVALPRRLNVSRRPAAE